MKKKTYEEWFEDWLECFKNMPEEKKILERYAKIIWEAAQRYA